MCRLKFYFVVMFACGISCGSIRNNILLIVVDDLRPSLGCYGDSQAHTPNINRMAADGITFHRAYAQQALCAPSRNSFLTSRRPNTLHLYDFYNYWRTFAGNFTTLPQYFKENNYETISIGKIFHPGESSNFTDDYPLSWSQLPWHPSTLKYKNSPVCYTKDGWFSNLVCPVRLSEQPENTLPDIESLEQAVHFLKSRINTSPFFLAVGFSKPHVPLKFPRQYLDFHPLNQIKLAPFRNYPPGLPVVAWNPWTDVRQRHDIAALNLSFPFDPIPDNWSKLIRQAYLASITYIDDLIGKLLHSLQDFSLAQNTIVVLLGDHGWSLGEHSEWSKFSNFEIALRVPLIFRVPKLTFGTELRCQRTGLESKELVELVDLFPTLVELTGLPKVAKCRGNSSKVTICTEGRSLLPLMLTAKTGKSLKKVGAKWRLAAFSQYPRPGEHPKPHPDSDRPRLKEITIMGYSMRSKRHRYTEWVSWNHKTFQPDWLDVKGVELYDHHVDPEENINLSGRPGLESLENKLRSQLRQQF